MPRRMAVSSATAKLCLATAAMLALQCEKAGPLRQEAKTSTAKLHEAIERCDLAVVRGLIESGIDVNSGIGIGVHPTGDTPLALALWEANKTSPTPKACEIMAYLIARGADVNARNRERRTLLHYPHNPRAVRLLLDAGAVVDAPSPEDGTTPLYRTDNVEVLRLLLESADKVNSIDYKGMTALDYHLQWEYARKDIIALLREHGAKTAAELGGGRADLRDTMRVVSASTREEGTPVLRMARDEFTYKGKPIHPKLVKQFIGWLSDAAPPVVLTVDVSAAFQAGNEYHQQEVRKDEGRVVWTYGEAPSPVQKAYFAYEKLGSLVDGTQVLKTYDCGGGSGVFNDLALVRFEAPRPDRLLMRVIKRAGIGDRNPAEIEVREDSIIVGPGRRGAEEWEGFEISLNDLR